MIVERKGEIGETGGTLPSPGWQRTGRLWMLLKLEAGPFPPAPGSSSVVVKPELLFFRLHSEQVQFVGDTLQSTRGLLRAPRLSGLDPFFFLLSAQSRYHADLAPTEGIFWVWSRKCQWASSQLALYICLSLLLLLHCHLNECVPADDALHTSPSLLSTCSHSFVYSPPANCLWRKEGRSLSVFSA